MKIKCGKKGLCDLKDHVPVGLLRYNLWDQIPFCTMLYIDAPFQGKGHGKKMMEYWEMDMKRQGHGMVLTSTQTDETAQHFYRKLGYQDCGGLVMNIPGYVQPMEIFLAKKFRTQSYFERKEGDHFTGDFTRKYIQIQKNKNFTTFFEKIVKLFLISK